MKINQSKEFYNELEEIDSMIDALIGTIEEDLSQAILIIRRIVVNSRINHQSLHVIMDHMQTFDLLYQRINHIKNIHSWIRIEQYEFSSSCEGINAETSLLRLNQLQFQLGIADYLEAMKQVKAVFITSTSHCPFEQNERERFLKDLTIVKSAIPIIDKKFEKVAKKARGMDGIMIPDILKKLERLYSIQSERNILYSYLHNPNLKWTDAKNISWSN